ncbi:helix-turn-helix transcriptional regulator [Arachnia propionica]|nr:metalloregulator ArsR/SmtB family transcription factor [Arachnia propionica]MDO5084609.1 metalloregulator ArsR/SmtB family transcription factor [Arachnia propionica]
MPTARIADYEPVAVFFKALANPVRAAIVHLLSTEERTVGQLVEDLGLAQPLVSQHLRVLRGASMVATRRQGQEIWYRICDQHIAHVLGDALNHTREGSHDHDH